MTRLNVSPETVAHVVFNAVAAYNRSVNNLQTCSWDNTTRFEKDRLVAVVRANLYGGNEDYFLTGPENEIAKAIVDTYKEAVL